MHSRKKRPQNSISGLQLNWTPIIYWNIKKKNKLWQFIVLSEKVLSWTLRNRMIKLGNKHFLPVALPMQAVEKNWDCLNNYRVCSVFLCLPNFNSVFNAWNTQDKVSSCCLHFRVDNEYTHTHIICQISCTYTHMSYIVYIHISHTLYIHVHMNTY